MDNYKYRQNQFYLIVKNIRNEIASTKEVGISTCSFKPLIAFIADLEISGENDQQHESLLERAYVELNSCREENKSTKEALHSEYSDLLDIKKRRNVSVIANYIKEKLGNVKIYVLPKEVRFESRGKDLSGYVYDSIEFSVRKEGTFANNRQIDKSSSLDTIISWFANNGFFKDPSNKIKQTSTTGKRVRYKLKKSVSTKKEAKEVMSSIVYSIKEQHPNIRKVTSNIRKSGSNYVASLTIHSDSKIFTKKTI